MSSEVELRNAATDLLSLLRDYMVVTSLTANDRFEEAVERLRVALSASPSIGRVKPLEWEPTGSYPFVAISSYYYIGHQSGDGRYWVHHRIFGDLREGDGTIEHHLTLDAAKAAAQEDHERKILWQIVGSSDPDVAPPNVEHLRPLADREKSAALVSHEETAGDTQGAGWLSQFTVNNCNHAALDSAVGVLRTGLASGSYQQALWGAIVDYVERAAPAALVSPPDNEEAGNG